MLVNLLVLGLCLALVIGLAVRVRQLHNALSTQSRQSMASEHAYTCMDAMINAMSRAVLVLNARGDVVWANAAAITLFKFKEAQPPYTEVRECFDAHTATVILGLLEAGPAEVSHSGKFLPDVPAGSFATAGGVPLSLNLDYLPVGVNDGQFMVIAQEISSSLRRKAVFEQVDQCLRGFLDVTDAAMVYCDAAHKVQMASRLFSKRFGLNHEEVVGQALSCIFDEADFQRITKAIEQSHETKGPVRVAAPAETNELILQIVQVSDVPGYYLLWLPADAESAQNLAPDPSGEEVTVSAGQGDGGSVNTAAQPKTFMAYQAFYHRLRYALDNLNIGVWEYQIPENRLIWDDRMYKMYDLERKDFAADYEAWASALLPEDFERSTQLVKHCIENKVPFKTTFRVPQRDGGIRMISADANIIYDDQGQALRMIGTNVDITEKHALEQAYQKALQEARALAMQRSTFMATMSHELRTPLNGVLGMLEMLLQSRLNIEQTNKVRIAQKSAESLLALLHDVLEISTLNAAQVVLAEQPFDLRRLIGDFSQSVAFAVEEEGLTLVVDAADIMQSAVVGDPDRIRQVLTNLVGNAKKFTRTGEIILRCTTQRDADVIALKIAVIDTGVGIDAETIEKIFDPFYQGDSSSTREFGGAGLGLSVCKSLCELMGGDITVESAQGQGAIFHVSVMLKPNPSVADPLPGALDYLDGRRILLVLENAAARLAVRRQLEQWGAIVAEASTGAEARQVVSAIDTWHSHCKTSAYDVALIERHLPDYSGPELVKHLREWGLSLSAPIVLCGAMLEMQDSRVLAEWGVAAYLPTPVAPIMLQETLATLLMSLPRAASTQHPDQQHSNKLPHAGTASEDSSGDSAQANGLIEEAQKPNQGDGQAQNNVPTLGNISAPTPEEVQLSYWMEPLNWPTDLQVLIVEDNEVNQEIVLLFLQEIGIEGIVAANGKEALTCLQTATQNNKPIHVIFMDCQMPEMDGYDATRAIRAGQAGNQYKNIPIIALTANALSGDREKCLAVGMDDYLSKPVAVEDFYARLAHWSGSANDFKSKTAEQVLTVSDPVFPVQPASLDNRFQEALSRVEYEHLMVWDKASAIDVMGSEEVLAQLVRVFCDRKNERLQKILFSFSHQDYESLAVSMHSLKGSADQLMGCQLAGYAAAIKAAALAHDQHSCEALRQDFIRSFERLESAFEQYLDLHDTLPKHPKIVMPEQDAGADAGPGLDPDLGSDAKNRANG